jgi:PhzF family phenazine biosynthesis protein
MDFPAYPATTPLDSSVVAAAIGATPVGIYGFGEKTVVELTDDRVVRELQPDFAAIAKLPTQGLEVTARSADPRYDFVSRFFAPRVGINEDPVTGSAHCALGPFWMAKLGKSEMMAYQASARGGEMRVIVRGERVLMQGQAVTVLSGEMRVS